MYPNCFKALKELTSDDSSKLLLTNWAQESNNCKWQEELIEAFCIIQNYKILSELDFDKKVLIDRFLPHHSFTSLHVNKFRKLMYFICDNLDLEETLILRGYVQAAFNVRKLPFVYFQNNLLELYFLYWETQNFIQPNNVKELIQIFKQMEKYDICDWLKDYNKRENDTTQDPIEINYNTDRSHIFTQILDPKKTLLELPVLRDGGSYPCPSFSSKNLNIECYHIDPENPGIILIINQEYFYKEVDEQFKASW